MSKYYAVLWPDDVEGVPIVAQGALEDAVEKQLMRCGQIDGWVTLAWNVREDVVPPDYLANTSAVRLCSARLRALLDALKGELDKLQWLEVEIENGAGERFDYYILHFPSVPEVIDRDRSIVASTGFVVKPVFSQSRLVGRAIFTFASDPAAMVVESRVRSAVLSGLLSGMDFSPRTAV